MGKMVLATLLLLLGFVPAGLPAQADSVGTCAARVAVLGANMSAGDRFEVQRALAVGPHTRQLDETLADGREEAPGLVPPDLLGVVAVSSGLLQPLPVGSGLTVWRGTVVSVAATGVAVRVHGTVHDFGLAPALRVYRNGRGRSIAALQPGDTITITANGAGLATLMRTASSVDPASLMATAATTETAGLTAVVAALLLLVLLLFPVLVGLLRRHRARQTDMDDAGPD
jgi:hypothetical protein